MADLGDAVPPGGDAQELAVVRGFARLETLLEKSAEDERRQFDQLREQFASMRVSIVRVQDGQSGIAADVAALEQRISAIEARERAAATAVKRAGDLASAASRQAGASVDEAKALAEGLIEHLRRLEIAREAEAAEATRQRDEAEAARQRAATAHAKRFETQGVAIAAQGEALRKLTTSIEHSSSLSARGKWILGAVIAIITVLGNQAVEAFKIVYTNPRTFEAPR